LAKDPYPHGSRGTPHLRDGTHDTPAVWYAAYGSNTRWEGLRRYLEPGAATPGNRWITLAHALYFAGASRRWEGGVAFVTTGPGPSTPARAWHLSAAQLHAVAAAENGVPGMPPLPRPSDIPPGGVALLAVDLGPDGTTGKYDALLRLPDIAGVPAVTLTTSRILPTSPPGAAYLSACRAGLAGRVPDVDAHLTAAVARGAPAA